MELQLLKTTISVHRVQLKYEEMYMNQFCPSSWMLFDDSAHPLRVMVLFSDQSASETLEVTQKCWRTRL